MYSYNYHFIALSGCSGGGKSTLIAEFKRLGYDVVEEIGRQIIREQTHFGFKNPLEDLAKFCKLLIKNSVAAYHQKVNESADNIVFFDRSFLEGVSLYQTLKVRNPRMYDNLICELRFNPVIFITPPWKEIYHDDKERKHSFAEAVIEHERLLAFYKQAGYKTILLPKVQATERIQFIFDQLKGLDSTISD